MKIDIIDTEEGFDSLETVWNDLADQTRTSFFSSFDYVRTAWKHFHGDKDRLFIHILSEADTTIGIAPFYIAHRRSWGIRCRVIKFIASWEGDRPQILCTCSAKDAWRVILNYLQNEFTDWEILDLMEQPAEVAARSEWFCPSTSGWYWESQPDAVDYYISPGGSWDEYINGLSAKTRKNWRWQTRRLSTISGGFTVERIANPLEIREALDRFVALELASWKAGTMIGVAKDDRHHRFYEDLIDRLAKKEQVLFHFLKIGQDDSAGVFSFVYNNVIYPRHSAYIPTHAEYSPGILILAEVICDGFLGSKNEIDLLGLKENNSSNIYKAKWATSYRETIQITGYRVWSKLLPVIAAKRLKRLLTRQRQIVAHKNDDVLTTIARGSNNV